MAKKKFIIFDTFAIIHRAYHAIPPLTTKKGEVVNAVYGFTNILLKVLNELKPDYIACAMDLPAPTFRHKKYKEYKATRQKAADDLIPQFGKVEEVLKAMNIPCLSKEGYEADDVIGSVSRKLEEKDLEIIIVTGDLDEIQLVTDKTKIYTMQRGFSDTIIYDEAKVHERYGLTPKEFIEYKALKGDPSDNIPGVPGIGEKTAIELIKTYKNLEKVYDNLDDLKPGVKKNLDLYREQAFLSRELSTIVTDIDLKLDIEDSVVHDFDRNKVLELFRELEFRTLMNRLPEANLFEDKEISKKKAITGKYNIVCTKKDFDTLLKALKTSKEISFDTETTSLDAVQAEIVGLCFSVKEKEGYYIPLGHRNNNNVIPSETEGSHSILRNSRDSSSHTPQNDTNNELQITNNELSDGQLELEEVLEKLKPILEDESINKIGHNLKYDYKVMEKYGIYVSPLSFDTMIAAYLLNPNARAQKLEELAFQELGIEMIPISELIGKGKGQINFCHTPMEEAAEYGAEDADVTLRLYNHYKPILEKEGFAELFEKIEMPLVPILSDMELRGIKIDREALGTMSKTFEKRILELEKKIWKYAGGEFNIASPIQLKDVLFEKMDLAKDPEIRRNLKKVKSGGYSTAAGELEKIRDLHPIIDLVSEYREVTKLKSTYVDAIPLLINEKSGRVHTTYNQAVTATGRLSSSDPNLQNIPIRTELGNQIRKAFIAEKGHKILAADYSQIELRMVAHIAEDKKMIESFNSGIDIHTRTAALVFGVKESEVTSNMRRIAKVVNFGVLYGMSPHGLSVAAGTTHEEAKDFIDKYFEVHKGIAKYVEETKEVAKEIGYVETLFGRKRYVPEIRSSNFMVRNAAERIAVNMPIQGGAADLMKLAMIDIDQGLRKISEGAKMLLQVHDELVFEVPEEDVKKVASFVKDKMEGVVKLKVPVEVKLEIGNNWGEMEELKL